jgi:hypothetical protein
VPRNERAGTSEDARAYMLEQRANRTNRQLEIQLHGDLQLPRGCGFVRLGIGVRYYPEQAAFDQVAIVVGVAGN